MKLFGKDVNPSNWVHAKLGVFIGAVGFVIMMAIWFSNMYGNTIVSELKFTDIFIPWIAGSGLALTAGLLKDLIWDLWLKKGTYELNDILFTLFGGMTSSTVFTLFIVITNLLIR
jgi:uncharacterized membrane protein